VPLNYSNFCLKLFKCLIIVLPTPKAKKRVLFGSKKLPITAKTKANTLVIPRSVSQGINSHRFCKMMAERKNLLFWMRLKNRRKRLKSKGKTDEIFLGLTS
jgi:hypothetical protein